MAAAAGSAPRWDQPSREPRLCPLRSSLPAAREGPLALHHRPEDSKTVRTRPGGWRSPARLTRSPLPLSFRVKLSRCSWAEPSTRSFWTFHLRD